MQGLPVLSKQEPHILHVPTTLKPIGIVYFSADPLLAIYPILPMHVAENPLDIQGILINNIIHLQTVYNSQIFQKPPDTLGLKGEFAEVPTQLASYHYNSWPKEDKEQALRLLQSIQ